MAIDKTPPTIEARNIHRSFRSTRKEAGLRGTLNLLLKPQVQVHEALKGISFEIQSGEFVGLIGSNGAGKTTLLKILSGLIPPTSGEAKVLGFEPFQRPLEFRKRISLVMGQKAQLWWDLPAIDAFELLRTIYEIPKGLYRERLATLAKLLEVQDLLQTQIRRLSLGERMKMELIGAILHWPSVIFLDEPTIGLDLLAAHKLRGFLRTFNSTAKATIILTSHNMEDIETLCPRVLILRSGELIYDGPPGNLTRKGERRLRIRLMENPSIQELSEATSLPPESITISAQLIQEGEVSGTSEAKVIYFTLRQDQIVQVIQRLLTRYQIIDMGVEEQSLEWVIKRLYEGKLEAMP